MTRLVSSLLASCLLLAAGLLGTPPARAQSAVDERAIIAAVSALDAAIDAKDWARVRELLLDEVTVALPDAETAIVPADELVAQWQEALHFAKTTFHLRGGERVTFDGADSAVVRSKAQVLTHVDGIAGDDLHELWSDYHHELDRSEAGWRIRHFGYVPRLEQGNVAVTRHRLVEPDAAALDEASTGDAAAEPAATAASEAGADDAAEADEADDDAPPEDEADADDATQDATASD